MQVLSSLNIWAAGLWSCQWEVIVRISVICGYNQSAADGKLTERAS